MLRELPDSLRISTIHGETRTLYVLTGSTPDGEWEPIVSVDARDLVRPADAQKEA